MLLMLLYSRLLLNKEIISINLTEPVLINALDFFYGVFIGFYTLKNSVVFIFLDFVSIDIIKNLDLVPFKSPARKNIIIK